MMFRVLIALHLAYEIQTYTLREITGLACKIKDYMSHVLTGEVR